MHSHVHWCITWINHRILADAFPLLCRSRHIYRCPHLSRAKAGCRSRCSKITTANLQTYELSNCSVKTAVIRYWYIDSWNVVYDTTCLSTIWVPSIFIFETGDKCGKRPRAMFLFSRFGHWSIWGFGPEWATTPFLGWLYMIQLMVGLVIWAES